MTKPKPKIAEPEATATRNVPQTWIHGFLREHGITWETGPPMRYDQFGTEYVQLGLGGPNHDYYLLGDRLIILASSEALAKSRYQEILLEFLGTKKHIIWRTEPEVECDDPTKNFGRRYHVYSRLTALQDAWSGCGAPEVARDD